MGPLKVKRAKVQKIDKSLSGLVFEKGGIIPPLLRDNEQLQSTAHTEDTGHQDAAPKTESDACVDITALMDGKEIYFEYDDNEQSYLLKQLGTREGFIYQNETEVQQCVMNVVGDALIALGMEEDLLVRPEISVFSYRPDVIVVTHSTVGIILVVEVKKPGTDVFSSHSVAGQVYDYLVGLLGMGVAVPFVVLTTYEEMVIAHLDDDGRAKKIMEDAAREMGNPLATEKEFLREGREKR